MSALGQKQTLSDLSVMSALPPKADINWTWWDVRFVPQPDIRLDHLRDHQKVGWPRARNLSLLLGLVGSNIAKFLWPVN
jgi:hypothetical protein